MAASLSAIPVPHAESDGRNLRTAHAFASGGVRAWRIMTAELALIDSLPVAAFATDAEGRVVRHNAAAAVLWGRNPDPGAARWSGAWRLLAADGRPSWCTLPCSPTPTAGSRACSS